jgi:hypothetical protein
LISLLRFLPRYTAALSHFSQAPVKPTLAVMALIVVGVGLSILA